MLDRGLRRRFDPLVEREARDAASETSRRARPRGPARAADVHDRPADGQGLRRRDLGRAPATTARCACGCTSPTWPRTCGRAAPWIARRSGAATRVYVPGAGRADAARGAVEPAPARSCRGAGPAGRHRGARAGRRARAPQRVPPHADPLRRAAGLPARGPDLRGRGARGRSRGRSRSPPRGRRPPRCTSAREARGALAVESVEPEFAFSAQGDVTAVAASEQTESHRLIEHLMIAANEAVATLLESRAAAGAVPRARAARAGERASG